MSYKDDLKTSLWQQMRLKVYQRDNFRCQAAHCTNTVSNQILHVHHLDYIPDCKPWEYSMDMLLTLCDKCHEKENNRPELEKYLANTLKMKGFLLGDLLHLSCKIDTDEIFTKSLLNILRTY